MTVTYKGQIMGTEIAANFMQVVRDSIAAMRDDISNVKSEPDYKNDREIIRFAFAGDEYVADVTGLVAEYGYTPDQNEYMDASLAIRTIMDETAGKVTKGQES